MKALATQPEGDSHAMTIGLVLPGAGCALIVGVAICHRLLCASTPRGAPRRGSVTQEAIQPASAEAAAVLLESPARSCCEFLCGSGPFLGQRGPVGVMQSVSTMVSVATIMAVFALAVAADAVSRVRLGLDAVLVLHIIVLNVHYRGLLAAGVAWSTAIVAIGVAFWMESIEVAILKSIVLCSSAITVTAHAYSAEVQNRQKFIVKIRALELSKSCQDLLRNMLPSGYHVERLMRDEEVVEELDNVVMLYSDIVGFTDLASQLKPHELITLLHDLYQGFDEKLDASSSGLYKMETVGDAFIVLGGLRASSVAGRRRRRSSERESSSEVRQSSGGVSEGAAGRSETDTAET